MQVNAQIGHEADSSHYGGEDWRRVVLDPPHVQRRRLEVDLFPAEVNHLGRAQPMPVG